MKHGINSNEMQKANRCLVLKIIMENGSITRQKLALKTGLHKATITNIINEFLEIGIITSNNNGKNVKRGELLRFLAPNMYMVSVAINRKDYRICLYSLDGTAADRVKKKISVHDNVYIIYEQLLNDIKSMISSIPAKNILGICVGMPGPYIRREHDIALVTGFEQLSSINIPLMLEKALDIPVLSEHDARLAAYAEWKTREKTQSDPINSLVTLRSIGLGVGAGIVIEGKMVRGQIGIAGEIGHMGINFNAYKTPDANHGIYEYYSGTESAVRYMLERLFEFPDSPLNEFSTYADIVSAYKERDPLAVYAMEKLAWMLGYGISSLVYLVNPDCIILDEDYPDYPPFLEKVKLTLKEFVHPYILETLTVRFSDAKDDTILLGGYYLLLEQRFQENTLVDCIRNAIDNG